MPSVLIIFNRSQSKKDERLRSLESNLQEKASLLKKKETELSSKAEELECLKIKSGQIIQNLEEDVQFLLQQLADTKRKLQLEKAEKDDIIKR